jgi:sulfatase modifying factor 1
MAMVDSAPALEDTVWIPEGSFLMGSDRHYPEEAPTHHVSLDGFWIDRYPVTNARFAQFVAETGYLTDAERPADPGVYPGAQPELLVPSSVVFVKPRQRVDLRNHFNWWSYVAGADWRHPEGPDSSVDARDNHPVVHVTFQDASAFAAWAGRQLPTEAEWERAARGGLESAEFAWGSELFPNGDYMANTWQGEFPIQNDGDDGFEGTSPVGYFAPNGYGIYDMIGNVWEWTSDFYDARHGTAGGCCAALHARRPHPAPGDERRLVPVRPQLLPALPPGGANGAGSRHLDLPPGLPLRHTRQAAVLTRAPGGV